MRGFHEIQPRCGFLRAQQNNTTRIFALELLQRLILTEDIATRKRKGLDREREEEKAIAKQLPHNIASRNTISLERKFNLDQSRLVLSGRYISSSERRTSRVLLFLYITCEKMITLASLLLANRNRIQEIICAGLLPYRCTRCGSSGSSV